MLGIAKRSLESTKQKLAEKDSRMVRFQAVLEKSKEQLRKQDEEIIRLNAAVLQLGGELDRARQSLRESESKLSTALAESKRGGEPLEARRPVRIVQRVRENGIVWCLVQYEDVVEKGKTGLSRAGDAIGGSDSEEEDLAAGYGWEVEDFVVERAHRVRLRNTPIIQASFVQTDAECRKLTLHGPYFSFRCLG